ncbi:MAG: hypothetical protein F6K17_01085 [Okeania sp. SIO3C4]|nr:hypothetical protein [Okeania sp. SIO3C4]
MENPKNKLRMLNYMNCSDNYITKLISFDELFTSQFINSTVVFNNIIWAYKGLEIERKTAHYNTYWYIVIENRISKNLLQRIRFSSKLIELDNIPNITSKVLVDFDDNNETLVKKIRRQVDWKLSKINVNTLIENPESFEYLERAYLEEHLFDLWYEENAKKLDEIFSITGADKEVNFNREDEIKKIYLEWFENISCN